MKKRKIITNLFINCSKLMPSQILIRYMGSHQNAFLSWRPPWTIGIYKVIQCRRHKFQNCSSPRPFGDPRNIITKGGAVYLVMPLRMNERMVAACYEASPCPVQEVLVCCCPPSCSITFLPSLSRASPTPQPLSAHLDHNLTVFFCWVLEEEKTCRPRSI